jgi:hypothetical protein
MARTEADQITGEPEMSDTSSIISGLPSALPMVVPEPERLKSTSDDEPAEEKDGKVLITFVDGSE